MRISVVIKLLKLLPKGFARELLIKYDVLRSRVLTEFLDRSKKLSLDQREAVLGGLMNNCSMILGKPGVGKSFIVKTVMIPFWTEWGIRFQVMAPTGIAALNIGNGACTVDKFIWNRTAAKPDYIVIDETSMMSKEKLADLIKRQLARSGTRVVFLGDFQQLPPPDENSTFAFEHSYFREVKFYHLTTVFRQSNPLFLQVLDDVGKGKRTSMVEAFIRDRSREYELLPEPQKESMFRLYYSNEKVNRYNTDSMNKIQGEAVQYYRNIGGSEGYRQTHGFIKALENCGLGDVGLKVGCRVIVTRNISETVVNGTRGVVLSMGDRQIRIRVEREGEGEDQEEEIIAYVDHMIEFDIYDAAEHKFVTMRATVSGLPVKPGYASTIHKAQGLTLNATIINLDIWKPTHGLMYVALSRVRKFTDVYIDGFNPNAVYCHPHVLDFITQPRHLELSPKCTECGASFMLTIPPKVVCNKCTGKSRIRREAIDRKKILETTAAPSVPIQELVKSGINVLKTGRGKYTVGLDKTRYSNISKTECRKVVKAACRLLTKVKGKKLEMIYRWFWIHSFLD